MNLTCSRSARLLAFMALASIPTSISACSSPPPAPGEFAFVEVTLGSEPSRVTTLRFIPGTRELLIARITGEVEHHRLDDDGESTTLLGSFTVPHVFDRLDCGLVSLAFDPDFATNHMFFVGHCTDAWHSGIGRLTWNTQDDDDDDDDHRVDYEAVHASYVSIIELGDERATQPWHNVGAIFFDPDDASMYALFGDKTIDDNAQDVTSPLGGIVHLVPSHAPGLGGYEPPASPAFSTQGADPIRHTLGFRSPWTGFMDDAGRIFVGDVGSGSVEEVNVVPTGGRNFGWPEAEGPCACDTFEDPIRHWGRSESHPYVRADPDAVLGWARVVWTARASRSGVPDRYQGLLDDAVLYGDMCVGFVRRMKVDQTGMVTEDEPVGHLANATGWDVGPDGYVYAVTFSDRCTTSPGASYGRAQLYRLER
ncbi:MAG: PQQ-dependent sugar dehydrogenase [Polyangiales bacterium]